MFRFFARLLLCFLFPSLALAELPPQPPIAAKAWLLIDSTSGQVLSVQNADQRLEPASLTKLMTAYIAFSALREGAIQREQSFKVSPKARAATGSRMFIDVGTAVQVEDLLKGMIVQSGNDASIALAEGILGSEENFVARMNREAKRLGMNDTQYKNANGMPDPEHYTTANDLAKLVRALMQDFPDEYARYYSIKEFRYNRITQTNRNRLLWRDSTVDGVKTGSTASAGYCLIASAKRGERRLISILLGAASDDARIEESLKLLNFGFQAYELVRLYAKEEAVSTLRVWKGQKNDLKAGFMHEILIAVPTGMAQRLSVQMHSHQPLIAPVQQGDRVATLKVLFEGNPYAEFSALALETVPKAGFFGRVFDTMRLWFK